LYNCDRSSTGNFKIPSDGNKIGKGEIGEEVKIIYVYTVNDDYGVTLAVGRDGADEVLTTSVIFKSGHSKVLEKEFFIWGKSLVSAATDCQYHTTEL